MYLHPFVLHPCFQIPCRPFLQHQWLLVIHSNHKKTEFDWLHFVHLQDPCCPFHHLLLLLLCWAGWHQWAAHQVPVPNQFHSDRLVMENTQTLVRVMLFYTSRQKKSHKMKNLANLKCVYKCFLTRKSRCSLRWSKVFGHRLLVLQQSKIKSSIK